MMLTRSNLFMLSMSHMHKENAVPGHPSYGAEEVRMDPSKDCICDGVPRDLHAPFAMRHPPRKVCA